MYLEYSNTTAQPCISYLGLVGLVAASVDKHFPIPVEHMELEDHYKRSHTQRERQPQGHPTQKKAS